MTQKVDDKEINEALNKAKLAKEQANLAGLSIEESDKTVSKETFIDIDGLPSGGSFYSTNLSGQALKVEDILLLSNITDKNVTEKFNNIFLRRIKGIAPRNILACDELFIALWLRESAFPQIGFPSQEFTCLHCDTVNEAGSYHFSLNDIIFDSDKLEEVTKKFIEGNGKYIVKLSNGEEFKISPLQRGHSEKALTKISQLEKNKVQKEELEQLKQLVHICINIDTDVTLETTIERVRNLSPVDFLELLKHKNESSLVVEPIVNIPCSNCKEVTPLQGYPFFLEYYIPGN